MNVSKKVLIHIGMPKTGTSSIQHTLSEAAQKKQLNDIFYPKYQHHDVAAFYSDRYEKLYSWFKHKYSPSEYQEFKNKYKETLFCKFQGNSKVIIASEFLNTLSIDQLHHLRSDLENLSSVEFKILVYLREPSSYYLSSIQQIIKASSSFCPPTSWKFNYLRMIDKWREVFSSDSLDIRPFEPDKFPGGSVILDFQECASNFFEMPVKLNETSRSRSNESVSAEGMIILQKYRELVYPEDNNVPKKDGSELLVLLQKSPLEIPQTKPRLLRSVSNIIRAQHQDELQALKEVYGVDIFGVDEADQEASMKDNTEKLLSDQVSLEDILESFDPDIVTKLLIWIIKEQLQSN